MTVETTIVVKFGDGVDSGAIAIVELDETMNTYVDDDGDTKVKTNFNSDDIPHFWIHYSDTLQIDKIEWSTGDVFLVEEDKTYTKEKQLVFVKEKKDSISAKDSISYNMHHQVSKTWFGNEGRKWNMKQRNITVAGSGTLFTDNIPAICDFVFTILADQYKLVPPKEAIDAFHAIEGNEEKPYPVIIVFYMGSVL